MFELSRKIRELSIPLIAGVVIAVLWANVSQHTYDAFVYTPIIGDKITFHWFVNDIFMVFFFAIAGVEIVNSLSKGGALNPVKKAVTPLMATFGGVLGPIGMFFILNLIIGEPIFVKGWGICTATDIALAWLVARIVFGKNHPAVKFLLLLAVVDDGIGLAIIAIFYPDPYYPVQPIFLLLVALAMGIAFIMNKKGVHKYAPYIILPGIISWIGMYMSHLHPALSLIFVIPFLPKTGKIVHDYSAHSLSDAVGVSTLAKLEHHFAPIVDFGLFMFGLANAGVSFAGVNNLTWIIFISLVVGKTVGISLFTYVATLLTFKLPDGMTARDVITAGVIAGMGLTVALFVADVAFTDLALKGSAKMGALFTAVVAIAGIIVGKLLKVEKVKDDE